MVPDAAEVEVGDLMHGCMVVHVQVKRVRLFGEVYSGPKKGGENKHLSDTSETGQGPTACLRWSCQSGRTVRAAWPDPKIRFQ